MRPILLAKTSEDGGSEAMLYNAQPPAGHNTPYMASHDTSSFDRAAYGSKSSVDLEGREADMGSIPMQDFSTRPDYNSTQNNRFPEPNPYMPAPAMSGQGSVAPNVITPGPPGYLDPPAMAFPQPRINSPQGMRQIDMSSNVRVNADAGARTGMPMDRAANRI
jgi:hypothetical protein